ATKAIKKKLEVTIDQMKTTPDKVPALIVGGGATTMPKDNVSGTSEVVTPPHFEVCGAIGATIAEIGSHAEGVADLEVEDRKPAIERITELAKNNLESAGGIKSTAEIVDIEEIPFAYMPGKRENIRVKIKGKVFQ